MEIDQTNSKLVSFEERGRYLLIRGHGLRDTTQSMAEASKAIYRKVTSTQSKLLLVDYSEVIITLPLSEAFNLIRQYESSMAFLKDTIAAAVFSEHGLEFGRYWSEVGNQRGFTIKLFNTVQEADAWLLSLANH